MSLICGNRVNAHLADLGERHGISGAHDMTPRQFNEAAQSVWLRGTDFQFQIKGDKPDPQDTKSLRAMQVTTEICAAPGSSYRGFIIPGATHAAVSKRFLHAMRQVVRGVHADQVYVLGSNRELSKEKEDRITLIAQDILPPNREWGEPKTLPDTEMEMMRLVVEKSSLIEGWQYHFPETPMAELSPNTAGNAAEFAKMAPPHGTYVLVSGAPHHWRQTMVFAQRFPSLSFVSTGYEAPSYPLGTYLDELARLLWQELQGFDNH